MRKRTLGTRERLKWVWDNTFFNTLKECKAYVDGLYGIHMLLTEFEGYDIIEHFNKEGFVDSVVHIIPDKVGHHYTKSSRTHA